MMKLTFLLFVTAMCLVGARETRGRGGSEDGGCKLPTADDTDCNGQIVDCEDQLEEANLFRGEKITCLDINSMNRDTFYLATESCNALRKCKCTIAYYLHCKYEPDEQLYAPPKEACFSADTLVDTNKGTMNLRTLYKNGDAQVKVINGEKITYSPVVTWMHAEEVMTRFHDITAGSHRVSMTSDHVIYTVPCLGGSRTLKFARELSIGECVLVEKDGKMAPSPITDLSISNKVGFYSPVTTTGTLVVNGIGASNYAHHKNERYFHPIYRFFGLIDKALCRQSTGLHQGIAMMLNFLESTV